MRISNALRTQRELDRQTLAPLGAACVDHGAAATGFHANQKAVGTCATDLGGLVSAFHFGNPKGLNDDPELLKVIKIARGRGSISPNSIGGTFDYRKFSQSRQHWAILTASDTEGRDEMGLACG